MGDQNEMLMVPTYRIGLAELYLLLRIRMAQAGRKNIGGVNKAFFEPETYQNYNKLVKSLAKKKLLERQEGNILLCEGLQQALEVILNSAHCMCFQNDTLRKKDQTLSFYYAEGRYAGILQDKKNSLLVYAEDRESLYMAFEKTLEAKGISDSFQPEKWEELYEEKIEKAVREAVVTHSGNRLQRPEMNLSMFSGKSRLYLLCSAEGQKDCEPEKDIQTAASWFGVILRELERLKKEGDSADGTALTEEMPPEEKSEFRRIVDSEGFPRTGAGFWFWILHKILSGFPGVIRGAAKKKFLPALFCLAWAVLLFFYNMFAACCLNDTFLLDKSAVWGNLTPYLIAGSINTPSALKGLNVDLGQINTSFLVWPMLMFITLIGWHLIVQIRTRKHDFFTDLLGIPGNVRECRLLGYGKGRQMWIPFLAVWVAGFFIMNPVTLFLAALYCLLIFAQKDNRLVRFCMLWRCAGSRKQAEAGIRQEPRTEKYRFLFFHMGCGFLLYGLVSLALWYAARYHFWIRLIVTMLMAVFALLEIFWPEKLSGSGRVRKVRSLLMIAAGMTAAVWFGSRYGIVLAADGSWSESGRSLGGLLHNAGFSTILGLTLMTVGLALGGPVICMLAGSCLAEAGVFAVGCPEAKAGDYVRKTPRQYFFGVKDGEAKAVFCADTEPADLAAGCLKPAISDGGITIRSNRYVNDAESSDSDKNIQDSQSSESEHKPTE